MSGQHRNVKRSRTIQDFFKRNNDESSTSMPSGPSLSPPICEEQPPSQPQGIEDETVRVESHQEVTIKMKLHVPPCIFLLSMKFTRTVEFSIGLYVS